MHNVRIIFMTFVVFLLAWVAAAYGASLHCESCTYTAGSRCQVNAAGRTITVTRTSDGSPIATPTCDANGRWCVWIPATDNYTVTYGAFKNDPQVQETRRAICVAP